MIIPLTIIQGRGAHSTSQIRVPQSYLAPNGGGHSDRTCNLPVGKGLMIPVTHVECSEFESPGASPMELTDCAKRNQDKVNSLYLKMDDKEYKFDNLTKYRTRTESFETSWPNKALFGIEKGGNSNIVADGWYIITEPVTKGNHTIYFKSSLLPDPITGAEGYATDIRYNTIAMQKLETLIPINLKFQIHPFRILTNQENTMRKS
jgi:hypothetical protein